MALWHAHDLSYKLLFSHQRMMSDLLLEYAPRKWVAALDLSALERVHSAFASDDLRLRRSDVIWRTPWKENGRPVYILLEFQSRVNRFMGLRTAVYSGMLCQELVRARQLISDGSLPSILVLVLYNGQPPWNAPQRTEDLFDSAPMDMKEYTLSFGYLLIEERAFSLEELRGRKNAAAVVFRLENSRNPQEIQQVVEDVQEWFPGEEHLSLRSSLATWMLNVLLPHRFPGVAFPMLGDLSEVQSMLYENIGEWVQNIEDVAVQRLLVSQLEQKFGALPATIRHQIESADSGTICRWATQLLQAQSLEQVFNGNGKALNGNAKAQGGS